MNKLHKLKIEKVFADKKLLGDKPWEWRVDDRGFTPGDFVSYSVNGCHDHDLNKMIFQIIYVLKIDEKHCVFTDRKLTEALKPVENQPDEPWKPKEGDCYFSFESDGSILMNCYSKIPNEQRRIIFGNCFKSYGEAEAARKRVKAALKGETISKKETVESLDGKPLADGEKKLIRLLRKRAHTVIGACEFAFAEGGELETSTGVLVSFPLRAMDDAFLDAVRDSLRRKKVSDESNEEEGAK